MSKNTKYEPAADALEALARCLYPAMVAYFESEEGQREFAEWQASKGMEILPAGEVKHGSTSRQAAWRQPKGAVWTASLGWNAFFSC